MKTWTGNFSSTQHGIGFIIGHLEIELDNDLNKVDYFTKYKLVYMGVFQHGTVSTGQLEIKNNLMILDMNSQKIRLLIIQKSPAYIFGTYSTLNSPYDTGNFEFTPGHLPYKIACKFF